MSPLPKIVAIIIAGKWNGLPRRLDSFNNVHKSRLNSDTDDHIEIRRLQ